MPPPTVLVTVGSTRFDALTAAALGAPFVRAVREAMGEDAVVGVQYGLSNVTLPSEARACTMHGAQGHAYVADGVTLFLFRYAPTLEAWVSAATLVVAHGGTMIEVLRAPSRPRLLVVPNATLMHDHQRELAAQLAKEGFVTLAEPSYVVMLTQDPIRYRVLCYARACDAMASAGHSRRRSRGRERVADVV